MAETKMQGKPELSFWQIWNMCFGFMGIQFGFALQNSNVSRIFQTLGADIDEVPILWVAAPLTGLIVQPIVGYFSDNTWNRLGRRRPYFLWGAIVTTLALLVMPNSPTLWIAAGTLWILDASINVTMEPFRAFVGDMLPRKQRTLGYVMQAVFIGIGAVTASAMPYIFTNWFGVENTAPTGQIPDAVSYSFYTGGAILFLAVAWTVLKTREYSPAQLASFDQVDNPSAELELEHSNQDLAPVFSASAALCWLIVGLLTTAIIYWQSWDPQLLIISLGLVTYGVLQLYAGSFESGSKAPNGFYKACRSVVEMPLTMRRLSVVQFFSWFPLFTMWIYTTAAVTSHHYGSSDPQTAAYNQGANWVGVLFASYSGFSIIAAMIIPFMVRMSGLKFTHQLNLVLGAIGLASIIFIRDPNFLLVSMVGVGFAWASIVSVPYAILANALPSNKMGIYMGVFNFFIVIPQLVAASVLGLVLKYLFAGEVIYVLGFGAAFWLLAAVAMFFVTTND